MFGCCGNAAKYQEGDLDDEMKRLTDLIKQEGEEDKEDNRFEISTHNKIYRKILQDMLAPGNADAVVAVSSLQEQPQVVQQSQVVQPVAVEPVQQTVPSEQLQQNEIINQENNMEYTQQASQIQSQQVRQQQEVQEISENNVEGEIDQQQNQPQSMNIFNTTWSSQQQSQNAEQQQIAQQTQSQPQVQQVSSPLPNLQTQQQQSSNQDVINNVNNGQQSQTQFTQFHLSPNVLNQQNPVPVQTFEQQSNNQQPSVTYSPPQSLEELTQSSIAQNNEIRQLKAQLQQQQQMFQQQMELMRAQQQKILEQEQKEKETQEILRQIQGSIQHQNAQLPQQSVQLSPQLQQQPIQQQQYYQPPAIYQQPMPYQPNPTYSPYQVYPMQSQSSMPYNQPQMNSASQFATMSQLSQSQRLRKYQNAKLSLTSNSLCGFDGNIKLFEVNLGQPGVVDFHPNSYKIIVHHKDGPIIIRADNEKDFTRWCRTIQKCIENARVGISEKNLIMKLDKATRQLFVYKGDQQKPSKIFQVGNCIVEVRLDNNYANLKVRCIDGKKFSFGDRLDVCQQWIQKFSECNGQIQYV